MQRTKLLTKKHNLCWGQNMEARRLSGTFYYRWELTTWWGDVTISSLPPECLGFFYRKLSMEVILHVSLQWPALQTKEGTLHTPQVLPSYISVTITQTSSTTLGSHKTPPNTWNSTPHMVLPSYKPVTITQTSFTTWESHRIPPNTWNSTSLMALPSYPSSVITRKKYSVSQ